MATGSSGSADGCGNLCAHGDQLLQGGNIELQTGDARSVPTGGLAVDSGGLDRGEGDATKIPPGAEVVGRM